jgi:hypothetical protein
MTTTLELEQKALAIPDQAQAITITNNESYEAATDLLLTVKELLKEVDNTFKPIIDKAYSTHREALAQRKRHEEPLLRAEQILKPRIAAYLEEQERIRKFAEKKAQDDVAIQEAEDATAMGDHAGAEAALSGQGVASVNIPSAAPKVAGIAMRDLWSAEVFDFTALIKAVAAGQVPAACLLPNQSALNQQARALKTDMNYPGVKAICVKTVAAGARL